ncbi:MAG: glycosyltransferase family 1 protein [Caldilineae bacterium]|nr:MAG: glycosyltransferase family 1 protein [Caldilineae bacterium]
MGLLATLLSLRQSYRSAGIHTYCLHLLDNLPAQATHFRYLAFVRDPAYRPPAGVTIHRPLLPTHTPGPRILWEQCALPFQARRHRLDLIHGLAYATPLLAPIPAVVTVHDLSFIRFPASFPASNRLYLSRITALSCRRARRVIAVSEATALDLQRLLRIPAGKIDVVYNGVDTRYHPLPDEEVAAYRRRAGWPEAFILTLGTLEPRKNHVMLLQAYAQYRRMSDRPLPLLIGGGKGWYYDTIFAQVEALELTPFVHFLGFVPAETLPWLYNAATLFVYPSRYEGFGLPVAEAMACGLPVITSSVSSLPEVAGDAALLVDPDDPHTLAELMATVLDHPEEQMRLREAGLRRAQRFRWHTTAADTAAVYTRALRGTHD